MAAQPEGGTPFASLPPIEQRRRILVGVQAGRMQPQDAAKAMRFYGLSQVDEPTLTFRLNRYQALNAADQTANTGGGAQLANLRAQGYLPGGAKAKAPTGPAGLAARAVGAVTGEAVKAPGQIENRLAAPERNAKAFRSQFERAHGRAPTLGEMQHAGVMSAGIVAPGSGIVAQTAAALGQRATYAPAGVVEAAEHPVRTAEQAAHDVIHDPLTGALAVALALHGAGQAASRIAGAGSAVREGAGLKAALARPGHAGGSLLHTPEPGTTTIFKPSGEKLNPRQAEIQKTAFPNAKPLRAMPQAASATVERLNSRNMLAKKLVQEPRNKAIQSRLIKGSRPVPRGGKAGVFFRQNLGSEATFGRELRAQRRVETAKAQAPVQAQRRATHGTLGQRTPNAGENEAARIAAVFGDQALENPRGVVAQVIRTHHRLIQQGDDAAAHREVINDARRALKTLQNPPKWFKKAVAETKATSENAGDILEQRGHLTAAERKQRLGAIYSVYHEDPAVQGLLRERAGLEKQLGEAKPPKDIEAETAKTQAKLDANIAMQRDPGLNKAPLTAEESQLRTKLDTLSQHKRLAEIDQQLQDIAPKGAFYFSQHARYTKNPPTGSGSGFYSPQPRTPGGVGPTQTSRMAPGLGHRFTGASVEAGLRPTSVFDSTADYATRVNRLTSAEDFYDKLWKIGSAKRETATQIPIRSTRQIKDELRLFFKKLDARTHGLPGANEAIDAKEYEKLTDLLQPEAKAGIGESVDGVRWVEPAYIKSLGEQTITSPVEKLFDTVTQPYRSLALYGRPAYLLNLPGNAGMQAITQRLGGFPAGLRAARSVELFGEPNTATVDSLMGASHARSYVVNKGPLAEKNRQLAEAWNALTDMWSRRSAFYDEAARAGFNTPDEISALLHNPANHSKLIEVTRRANKNIVDFGSLTPAELTARHYIYFYAWTSRATLWALRELVEHPGKAFTALELGKIGAAHADKVFGPMPQWVKDSGVFPVGKAKNGEIKTVNPSSIWTATSAVDALEAVANTAKGLARAAIGLKQKKANSSTIADSLTPGLQAAVNASGTGGDASSSGGLLGLPQATAVKRFYKGSKTYPDTGAGAAVGPLIGGGLYPRGTSIAAINKGGRTEALAAMSPTRKATFLEREQQTKLIANARKTGLLGKKEQVPPELRQIFSRRTARAVAYANANAKTERQRFTVDIDLLARDGAVTAQSAAQAKAELPQMTDKQVESLRRRITDQFFGGSTLRGVNKRVNDALDASTAPAGTGHAR